MSESTVFFGPAVKTERLSCEKLSDSEKKFVKDTFAAARKIVVFLLICMRARGSDGQSTLYISRDELLDVVSGGLSVHSEVRSIYLAGFTLLVGEMIISGFTAESVNVHLGILKERGLALTTLTDEAPASTNAVDDNCKEPK